MHACTHYSHKHAAQLSSFTLNYKTKRSTKLNPYKLMNGVFSSLQLIFRICTFHNSLWLRPDIWSYTRLWFRSCCTNITVHFHLHCLFFVIGLWVRICSTRRKKTHRSNCKYILSANSCVHIASLCACDSFLLIIR